MLFKQSQAGQTGGHNPKDPGGDFNPNPKLNPSTVVKVVAGATAVTVGVSQIGAAILDFVATASGMKALIILGSALISVVDDSKEAVTFNVTRSGLEFTPVSAGDVSETASTLFFPVPKTAPKGTPKGLGNKNAPNPGQGAWERGQVKNAEKFGNEQVMKHNNLKGNMVGDSGGQLNSNYSTTGNSNLKNGAILTGTGVE